MNDSPTRLSRRTVFAGVGVAAAVATLTRVIPPDEPAAQAPLPVNKPGPRRGGGYTLSEHVKQYYQTARL